MKLFLLGTLTGCLIASATYGVRDFVADYHQTKLRVSYIEGYLGQLDTMMRGGR
jgi:hypothetical protein